MKIKLSKNILLFFVGLMLMIPGESVPQRKLVKVVVASPYIQDEAYMPIADVVAGTIIRELKRFGGLELIDREIAEEYIYSQGGIGWVANRDQAYDLGKSIGADIVIYVTLKKNYDMFTYTTAFLEVERDIIQRVLNGSFRSSESASEIGRIMKKDVDKLYQFIPAPSELNDPGMTIRMTVIDPDKLPKDHDIEDFPEFSRYGAVEQVLTYFRVFPGEFEYQKFEEGTRVMRFGFRDETLDGELNERYNIYNQYGDFAIRHDLQAFFIKNCSTRALNVLLANDIPVFYNDDLLVGYRNLQSDGFCLFRNLSSQVIDTTELSHRSRIVVMFMVPRPGKQKGVSKEYLESALERYNDEWGESPELLEVKEGIFDIISSGTE